MLNSSIVAIAATIEETMRTLFREYLSILEELLVDHTKLRKELRKANINCAIMNLKHFNKSEDFNAAADLVANLGKCLNGDIGYQLLKDDLTRNQSNFQSQQVTDIAKNAGVNEIWMLVCNDAEILTYTGEEGLQPRITKLIAAWNELFDERNLIVHRLSQASGWGSEKIDQSIDLSILVVRRIASCLVADIADQAPETT